MCEGRGHLSAFPRQHAADPRIDRSGRTEVNVIRHGRQHTMQRLEDRPRACRVEAFATRVLGRGKGHETVLIAHRPLEVAELARETSLIRLECRDVVGP